MENDIFSLKHIIFKVNNLRIKYFNVYLPKYTLLILSIVFFNKSAAQNYSNITNSLKEDNVNQTAGDDYIRFYQNFLSDQKNSHCAMFPSCSDYGRLIIQSKPFYKAIPAIVDRLTRCSRDSKFYPVSSFDGHTRYIDLHNDSLIHHNDEFHHPYADVIINKNNPLAFINHLINIQDYSGALLEIRRELFYNPNDELYLPKIICYRGLKNPLQGVFEYETKFPERVRKSPRVAYQAALSYYELGNYYDLRRAINNCRENTCDSLMHQKMHILTAMSYIKEEKYDSAQIFFNNSFEWNSDKQTHYYNLNNLQNLKDQSYKNPAIAKSLSIIPGLGYLYTGHKGSALTSLIVNGLLGYATYTCLDKKNYGIGIICGFLNVSFYIGNLNGAARSAHRYNQNKKNKYIKNLEKHNQILLTY